LQFRFEKSTVAVTAAAVEISAGTGVYDFADQSEDDYLQCVETPEDSARTNPQITSAA